MTGCGTARARHNSPVRRSIVVIAPQATAKAAGGWRDVAQKDVDADLRRHDGEGGSEHESELLTIDTARITDLLSSPFQSCAPSRVAVQLRGLLSEHIAISLPALRQALA